MMKSHWATVVCLALTLATLAGCEKAGSSDTGAAPGRVAIVDLDAVAAALGRTQQIQTALQAQEQEVQQRLRSLQGDLRAASEQDRAQLGEKPEEQQTQEFLNRQRQREVRFQQELQRAQQDVQATRLQLIAQFRNEIKPVAQRVAQERGMSVVMVKFDGLLSHDADVEITQGVIDAMKQANGSNTIPPVPAPGNGTPDAGSTDWSVTPETPETPGTPGTPAPEEAPAPAQP